MGNQPSEKEIILNDAFNTWFNSRYKELIASELLQKWKMVDTFCQIGIALTAAGSAIAGWQFWEKAEMKIVWSAISGMISLAAVGHKGFRVVDKVKIWSEATQAFTMLKNQLETLRFEVNTSLAQNLDNIKKTYLEIRKSYTEEDKKIPDHDLWLSKSLETRTFAKIHDSNEKTNFDKELMLSKERSMSEGKTK